MDDVLVVTRAEVERRVLRPVLGGEGTSITIPGLSGKTHLQRRTGADEVLDWIDSFSVNANRSDLRVPWRAAALATQRHRRAYSLQDLTSYRCVLVPRQSHPFVRALIQAARAQGVAVAYLPHSPLTTWHVDLPVTHAGVRGPAERDQIVAVTGANPERIEIVGNPSTDILSAELPMLASDAPGVLALGAMPETRLNAVLELLNLTGLDDVVVAPHPRTDRRALQQLMPRSWSVFTGGRTTDLLGSGPPWVLQASSGIAWESTALGIPTATIRLPGDNRIYPFLESPEIPEITEPGDVLTFVDRSPRIDRDDLRKFARAWCALDGTESVERARSMLDSIARGTHYSLIADAWSPGGALLSQSRLVSS